MPVEVLLVIQDKNQKDRFGKILASKGYKVWRANDLAGTLNLCQSSSADPDVVILDRLPVDQLDRLPVDQDEQAFLRQLRRNHLPFANWILVGGQPDRLRAFLNLSSVPSDEELINLVNQAWARTRKSRAQATLSAAL